MKRTLFSILLLTSVVFAAPPGYHITRKIPVTGDGTSDCITVDSASHRLYVSKGTGVMVVDLITDKVVGEVPDTVGVHGIAIASELNRGFATNGHKNTMSIFDLTTLKVISKVKTGEFPDSILYDPASRRVFIFNNQSNDASVFNAADGELVGTIRLGGSPDTGTADGRGKVFVNIEDTNEVAEIDSKSLSVTRRFSINPGQGPSGIALDREHNRIYSGCSNNIMTVLDIKSGKVIGTLPIGEEAGGNAFDPGTGLVFSSGGDGKLMVAREASPGKFEVVETVTTQGGARTMALDSTTHRIYLVAPRYEPDPSTTEKSALSDAEETFAVLVVDK